MGERKWYTIRVKYKHNPKLMFVPSSTVKVSNLLSSQASYLHCCTHPFFERPGGLCDVPCFSFPFWLLQVTLRGLGLDFDFASRIVSYHQGIDVQHDSHSTSLSASPSSSLVSL